MNNNVTIPIDAVSEKFKAHLNLKGNSRIIFSGKYGVGKTRFLNMFFKANEEHYNLISISPAKYVVSSNEDIFDLIKVDIILQLSQKGFINAEQNENDFNKVSKEWFVYHQPSHFLKFLSKVASKIDIPNTKINSVKNLTSELVSSFLELNEKYRTYLTKIEHELKSEEDKLNEFVNSFTEANGNIFELNFITLTIQNILINANKNGLKENILVIDDLDRVDPEHIFRILNILSAHNDYWGSENKFGFDKIILVCDIDNIQKIYEHRYGQVDFEGYMDKFYTTDYFRFDNRDAIKFFFLSQPEIELSKDEIAFLALFFDFFLTQRKLTLRQITKVFSPIQIDNFTIEQINLNHLDSGVRRSGFIREADIYFQSESISFLRIIRLLISVFGDLLSLKKALNSFQNNNSQLYANDLDSAIKALALIYYVSTSNEYTKCFGKSDNRYNNTINLQGYSVDIDKYPEVSLLGTRYKIQLIWNSNSPYQGKGCFLKNVSVIKMNYESNNQRTVQSFFAALTTIIEYLEKRGGLSKMGVGAVM